MGLGVTYLSMASSAIASVGVQLGNVTLKQCQDAAEAVLRCATVEEAKATAAQLLA